MEPEIPGRIGSMEKTSGGEMTEIKRVKHMHHSGVFCIDLSGGDNASFPEEGQEAQGVHRMFKLTFRSHIYQLREIDGELILQKVDHV